MNSSAESRGTKTLSRGWLLELCSAATQTPATISIRLVGLTTDALMLHASLLYKYKAWSKSSASVPVKGKKQTRCKIGHYSYEAGPLWSPVSVPVLLLRLDRSHSDHLCLHNFGFEFTYKSGNINFFAKLTYFSCGGFTLVPRARSLATTHSLESTTVSKAEDAKSVADVFWRSDSVSVFINQPLNMKVMAEPPPVPHPFCYTGFDVSLH